MDPRLRGDDNLGAMMTTVSTNNKTIYKFLNKNQIYRKNVCELVKKNIYSIYRIYINFTKKNKLYQGVSRVTQ
jgi:hypothetical protein